MRGLLRLADLSPEEVVSVLQTAFAFKASPRRFRKAGRQRVVALLFEKPSLRTRFSLEAALARIGAHPAGAYDAQAALGGREPLEDAARALSRYCDAIVVRTFGQDRLEALARAASVPVINALSDAHHPLQALADLMTLAEARGGEVRTLQGLRLAWVGDGNNVCHSLIEAAALCGLRLACACPPGYGPDPEVVAWARQRGGEVEVGTDPRAAVAGAAAVYTDVWASMGREGEAAARRAAFAPYRVTPELMALAAPGAIFLHCLPAHRGEEVAAEVIDGPASRVWDQAENRMHTAAAVFVRLFSEVG